MSHKMGFLTIFAFVVSSQIGSGIFMLPTSLAPYGAYSIISWVLSGIGAISLALVFALLCAKFPKTGGPHVYIKHAFGSTIAFFVGWTYWISSWISSTAVVIASINYLFPLLHYERQDIHLILEIVLVLIIMLINLRGVTIAGHLELLLTLIKIIALFAIPGVALLFFDKDNFVVSEEVSSLGTLHALTHSILLTLWCFIGFESVTTSAESVVNPSKTIPKAILIGMICVTIIYFINNLAIMGLINGNDLLNSRAPYVDVIKIILPDGNWYLVISIVAFIVSVSSLNAWVLSSGQVILGLAKDKLIPQFFAKRNKYDVPFWGIFTSSIGTIALLILTLNDSLSQQITSIIDLSVVSFLFVYLACSFALLKLFRKEKNYSKLIIGIIATIFCCLVLFSTSLRTLLVSSLFTISGIPFYLLLRYKIFKLF